MKEAAGEANLTVVAIILIGVIVAVATPVINSMMKRFKADACCTDSGGYKENGTCTTEGTAAYQECMNAK